MLKRLQDLLFEDVDDDDDGEIEEVEDVQLSDKRQTPAAVPAPEPVTPTVTPAAPVSSGHVAMQRIDVTQPVQFPDEEPAARSVPKNDSVFRESAPVRSSIDIKADTPAEKTVSAETKPAKKESKTVNTGYQFRPVISPIYGVGEKDMNALKTTTKKISKQEKAKQDKAITPVLSPIYGESVDDAPSLIQSTVEKSDFYESLTGGGGTDVFNDNDLADFSLDDILKVRDDDLFGGSEASLGHNNTTDLIFPELNLDDDKTRSQDDTRVFKRTDFGN